MHCSICGRFIESESKFCHECEIMAQQEKMEKKQEKSDSFGKAFRFGIVLASIILGIAGYLLAMVGLTLAVYQIHWAFVPMLLSIPFVGLAFVMGFFSVKYFKRKRSICTKPIATLVLGIVSIVLSGLGIYADVMTIFIMFH